jgi:hypothetical protein
MQVAQRVRDWEDSEGAIVKGVGKSCRKPTQSSSCKGEEVAFSKFKPARHLQDKTKSHPLHKVLEQGSVAICACGRQSAGQHRQVQYR